MNDNLYGLAQGGDDGDSPSSPPEEYLSWEEARGLFARLSSALDAMEGARLERASALIRSTPLPDPKEDPDAFGAAFIKLVAEGNLSGDEAVRFFHDIQVRGVASGVHRAATRLEVMAHECRGRSWLLRKLASLQPYTGEVGQPCPCCGYATLRERWSYEICPVCFWEDDGTGEDYPDEAISPNYTSLRQARRNFIEFGASDAGSLPFVRHPSENERKGYRLVPLQKPDDAGRQQGAS